MAFINKIILKTFKNPRKRLFCLLISSIFYGSVIALVILIGYNTNGYFLNGIEYGLNFNNIEKEEGLDIIDKDLDNRKYANFTANDIIGGVSQFPIENVTENTNQKLILIWNAPHIDNKNLGGCSDWRCQITSDSSLAYKSDAIVFYEQFHGPPPDAYQRKLWQYYVYFTLESPVYSFPSEPYASFYNLTMTYRRDSDVPCLYGYAIRRQIALTETSPQWQKIKNLVADKSKLAAWFVSNCKATSQRDKLVSELSKFMQIDVYGSCGSFQCPRETGNSSVLNCNQILSRQYKFYMALENSLCKDYVTEKFWHRITLGVVPVVMKRAYVEKYAPPHSFVAADDFETAELLANYLMKVADDSNLYLKYFEWRLKYRVIFLSGTLHDYRERFWGFCKLCQILRARKPIRKTYPKISDWWTGIEDEKSNSTVCEGKLVNSFLKIMAFRMLMNRAEQQQDKDDDYLTSDDFL